ncbi:MULTISPECIES: MFS transporter [unclassified Nocardiopsis]|uniref:MFS transporter n=1 Tax=unclassified Nocardiopsis TaxID=2649073 RepID=UPI00135CC122|nr:MULTISPECIES: MFS transporter [unclassified Nocardiopsis]
MTVVRSGNTSLIVPYTFFTLLSTAADFVFGAVFVMVMLDRGAEPWLLGLMFGSANLVTLLVEAPSGALGDRYGHRRLLTLGLALWGAGFVLFGTADRLALVLAGMYLWATGLSLHSGTLTALVVNRIGTDARAARISRVVRIGQVAGHGGGVTGAVSVMVFGTWASAGTLVAAGGGALVCLAVLAPLCFPRSPRQPDRRVGRIVAESAALLATRRFLPLVALTVSLVSSTALLVAAWQPLLREAHGGDVRLNGLVLLALTSALAAGAACARFVDRGQRPHVWAPLVAALSGVPLVLVAHGLVPLVPGLIAAEFLLGLGGVLSNVWQQLMFTDANRNTMFSMLAMVAGTVRTVILVPFGGLWDLVGLAWAATVLVSASVVAAVATGVLTRLLPESTRFTGASERKL